MENHTQRQIGCRRAARSLRFCAAGILLALTACRSETPPPEPVRPVRTTVVHHAPTSEKISLTGAIQARNPVNLAFKIGGRLVERTVSVGDSVTPGQVVARLENRLEQNTLMTAEADVEASHAALDLATKMRERQNALLAQGATARVFMDQAEQQFQAATAQVQAAEARLRSARENVSYTELHADAAGTVTAKGAEPGEVVQAGQPIVRVARDGVKDAVFNMPAALVRDASGDMLVTVTLSDDPSVTASGNVREVAPQADPSTGTYEVKVGLDNPPEAMRLGATVTGTLAAESSAAVSIPGTALTRKDTSPAVWVVDPKTLVVLEQPVTVERYSSAEAVVSEGLKDGDIVVVAGVHALRPGETVRLLEPATDDQS